MTALPVSSAFTDSSVTEANFKTAITNQRDFLAGLLGNDGVNSTALKTLGALGNDTVAKSANYTVIATDRGVVFVCTGTFTLSLTAAATLADGFTFAVINVGTGIVTIDPSSTEQIDGANTKDIAAGSWAIVSCTGTAFYSMGSVPSAYVGGKVEIFTTSGTWNVPDGVESAIVTVIGAGGAGQLGYTTGNGGRGGRIKVALDSLTGSYTVTIGTGSSGAGGTSSFGALVTATGGAAANLGANGADGAGSSTGGTVITNNATQRYIVEGQHPRPAAGGAGSTLSWSATSSFMPGAGGQSTSSAGAVSYGVSGLVIVEY